MTLLRKHKCKVVFWILVHMISKFVAGYVCVKLGGIYERECRLNDSRTGHLRKVFGRKMED